MCGGGGERGSGPPQKSQVAISFFRKAGTDPHEKKLDPFSQEKELDPLWVQLLLEGGPYGPP